MRKVAPIMTWLGIATWFVVVMGFVSGESEEVLCNRIDVILQDTVNNRFVTRSEVRSLIESSGIEIRGYPLAQINTRSLEHLLEENPYIRNAEVSKDVSGRLEVLVEQRVPLVRILPAGSRGYYLDTEGKVLPLSDRFTPLIMLASGKLPKSPGEAYTGLNLEEIFQFCTYLADNQFWYDQVVQIYVNALGEYELIPRVGAHHILLGTMDQWEKKLRNLELLYRQGLSTEGWNTYETINLKYTNQVICTKR
ncbi:MAG: FtsQ-type POTRA domain-containing protein [Bacteroidetes bacterium]|nr:FtsQ-type POTRA domain-containing protein [Bacteroidota bacterium]